MTRLFPIALAAFSLLLFRGVILAEHLPDENSFLHAFELVARGRSPYEYPGYLYPPPLAEWGARSVQHLGLRTTLIALRSLNAIGAALIAWFAACLATPAFRARAVVSVTLLFVPPFIASGVYVGNPSALAAGLVGLGLLCIHRRPALAALPIGVSLAIKPLVVGALVIFAMHRRTRRTAALAVVIAALIVAATPRFALAMLSQRQELHAGGGGNMSLHRVLALLGIAPPAAIVSAAVLLGFAFLARRVRGPRSRTCVALAASVFALPRVWGHTLALFVPVLVVSLARMPLRAEPGEARDERDRRRIAITVTISATIGLLLYDGLSFFPVAPRPVQAVLAAVPLACAGALTYLATRRAPGMAP